MSEWESGSGTEQTRPSRRMMAAIGSAVLVLAVVGGTTGYVLAGGGRDDDDGFGQSTPPTSVSSTTASGELTSVPPTSAPPVEPTTAAPATNAPGGFPLPDVTGTDFEDAHKRLRGLRLGVVVVFGQSGDDKKVSRTEPRPGASVKAGVTVKLFVRGMAPVATVPGIVDLKCSEVASIVADHGFLPSFPSGREGVVLSTDPAAGSDSVSVRWNDVLKVYCGVKPSTSP